MGCKWAAKIITKIPVTMKSQGLIFKDLFHLFFIKCQVDSNGDSYSSTYHRVVTHAEEAHHLKLSVFTVYVSIGQRLTFACCYSTFERTLDWAATKADYIFFCLPF